MSKESTQQFAKTFATFAIIAGAVFTIACVSLFMQWLSWNGPQWIMREVTPFSRYDEPTYRMGRGTVVASMVVVGGVLLSGLIALYRVNAD